MPYHRGGDLRGSTPLGLAFGIAAGLIILFETALNFRKRVPTWGIGRAETWLKGHIWIGVLTIPLVLFHSGFRFRGSLAVALSVVMALVVLSGIFGLVLQQYLPRLMTRLAPGETIYEQIPHVIAQLRVEAYEVVAAVCGPVAEAAEERAESERVRANPRRARRVLAWREAAEPAEGSTPLRTFYLEVLRPFLQGDGRTGPLADPAQTESLSIALRRVLPPALHEAGSDLVTIGEERRDLATQRRLHALLHGWLFVHVPLTGALLVLLAAHAVLALRYSY